MITGYAPALVLTLALEVPVVAAFYRGQRWRMALVALFTTSATHLAMHFVLPRVVTSFGQWIVLGEVGALLVEGWVYFLAARPRELGRALLASTAANALSYAVGLALLPALAAG